MIFSVENTLGALAKWLRFLGFEVRTWHRSLPPPQEGVIIIRRSQPQPKEMGRPDVILLQAEQLPAQLAELQARLPGLAQQINLGRRCSRCNSLLRPRTAVEVEDLVPEYVRHRFQEFYECPRCQKIYWPGSHMQRIQARLAPLIALPPESLDHE